MLLPHGSRLGLIASLLLVACSDGSGDSTVQVRVLDAVPGDEVADVRHANGKYLTSELRFGDLTSEFSVPAGAHEIALVLPPEPSDDPPCRGSDEPPSPCTPDVILAATDQEIAANVPALVVFSERYADNREGFVVSLRASHDDSPWGDTDASVRFVHAMPDVGTVIIDDVAVQELRFGFRAITEEQRVPVSGLSITVRDVDGDLLFSASLDLMEADPEARVFTAVLIGAGTELAPFEVVLVPG